MLSCAAQELQHTPLAQETQHTPLTMGLPRDAGKVRSHERMHVNFKRFPVASLQSQACSPGMHCNHLLPNSM